MVVFIRRKKTGKKQRPFAQAVLDKVCELADEPQEHLLAGIDGELRRVVRNMIPVFLRRREAAF